MMCVDNCRLWWRKKSEGFSFCRTHKLKRCSTKNDLKLLYIDYGI